MNTCTGSCNDSLFNRTWSVLKGAREVNKACVSTESNENTKGNTFHHTSLYLSLITCRPQLYYTSNIFFFLGLGLSKLSVVMLLLRITPRLRHKRVFYAVAVFVGAWTGAAILALALQCDLAHPWTTLDQRCPGSV